MCKSHSASSHRTADPVCKDFNDHKKNSYHKTLVNVESLYLLYFKTMIRVAKAIGTDIKANTVEVRSDVICVI